MKGQSAIEYLATYSWMILGVAVVSGIAYSNIDAGCTRSSSDFYTDTIDVKGFGIDNSENLVMEVQNSRYQDIRFKQINITIDDDTKPKPLGFNLSSGRSNSIVSPGFQTTSGCNTLEVNIKYSSGNLGDQVAKGIIRAPISFNNS